jgi:hypothetical protein
MCKLQSLIKAKFNDAKLLNYQSADEVIALGCAKQCRIISNTKITRTVDQDSFFKCLSSPLYLRVNIKLVNKYFLNEMKLLAFFYCLRLEIAKKICKFSKAILHYL